MAGIVDPSHNWDEQFRAEMAELDEKYPEPRSKREQARYDREVEYLRNKWRLKQFRPTELWGS